MGKGNKAVEWIEVRESGILMSFSIGKGDELRTLAVCSWEGS